MPRLLPALLLLAACSASAAPQTGGPGCIAAHAEPDSGSTVPATR